MALNSTHAYRELVGGLFDTSGTCADCENRSYINYDLKQNDVPVVNGETYKQSFVNEAIAKTENQDVVSWYSYDYAGRLKWLIKEYKSMPSSQKYKTWEYVYDVNNGNLLYSNYQKGTSEAFSHRYEYDANNRLLAVFTNKNQGETPTEATYEQARYVYYKHGPLKRVELAGNLQGIDYVYRLNGALKSINNPAGIKDMSKDPGQDGSGNGFYPDQFAVSLDYFSGDYQQSQASISGLDLTSSSGGGSAVTSSSYTGNITSQRWLRRNNASSTQSANQNTYVYNYDALNRLDEARFGFYNPGNLAPPYYDEPTYSSTDNYKVQISYYENGNITNLKRHQDTGILMDDFSYNYNATGNQLNYVSDSGTTLGTGENFEDQTINNYIYDASGRLSEDNSQLDGDGISYTYNTEGLVTEVRNKTTDALLINLYYDERGFRYRKQHYDNLGVNVLTDTWYVRDASGQLASVYVKNGVNFEQKEIPFYGASRIGTANTVLGEYQFQYELKDHLGNVRQTILTDNEGNIPTEWNASAADYYPFGMKFLTLNSYRFGYQGEYAEDETGEEGLKSNTFQLRLYNPRLGRWLSTDPYGQFHSPYLAMGNNPIGSVDVDGGFSNPIYDSEGFIRGYTSEGHTGVPIIYDGDDMDFSSMTAEDFVDGGYGAYWLSDAFNCNVLCGPEALSNIATHMIENALINDNFVEQFDSSMLVDDKVYYRGKYGSIEGAGRSKTGNFSTNRKSGKITMYDSILTGKGAYEPTVENMTSTIVNHEWYGHFKMGWIDDNFQHHKVYENTMNSVHFSNTTLNYKIHTILGFRNYKIAEEARQYTFPVIDLIAK